LEVRTCHGGGGNGGALIPLAAAAPAARRAGSSPAPARGRWLSGHFGFG
jgi:hypothetical protein